MEIRIGRLVFKVRYMYNIYLYCDIEHTKKVGNMYFTM